MNKCKMGCQRAVSPGLTRRGNKWSTCCRKCTTTNSESHDHHCIKRNKKYLKKMQQWICSYCTLSNNVSFKSCELCNHAREPNNIGNGFEEKSNNIANGVQKSNNIGNGRNKKFKTKSIFSRPPNNNNKLNTNDSSDTDCKMIDVLAVKHFEELYCQTIPKPLIPLVKNYPWGNDIDILQIGEIENMTESKLRKVINDKTSGEKIKYSNKMQQFLRDATSGEKKNVMVGILYKYICELYQKKGFIIFNAIKNAFIFNELKPKCSAYAGSSTVLNKKYKDNNSGEAGIYSLRRQQNRLNTEIENFKHKCKLITCDGETKEINGYNPFLLAIRMYGGEAFTCHYVNHSYDWNKNNIKIYEQALIDDEQVLNGCVYGNYISYGLNLLRAYGSAKDIKRNKKKRKIRNLKRMRKSFNEMEKGKTYYLCLRCEVQG
eukprot:534508_1